MNAELAEQVLRVGQDVHQMGNRGALIAANIGDAGLQQGFGQREDAFAPELLAFAEFEVPNFSGKRTFGHSQVPGPEAGAPAGLAIRLRNCFNLKTFRML